MNIEQLYFFPFHMTKDSDLKIGQNVLAACAKKGTIDINRLVKYKILTIETVELQDGVKVYNGSRVACELILISEDKDFLQKLSK